MPVPVLLKNLRGRRLLAWETVRDKLMRAEALKGLSPVWILPDSADFDNPPPDNKVSIRLAPKAGSVERVACAGSGRSVYQKMLDITYDLATPGGNEGTQELWENVAKLNEAVERELQGHGLQGAEMLAFHAALQAGGVDDLEVIMAADWDQPGMIAVTCWEES